MKTRHIVVIILFAAVNILVVMALFSKKDPVQENGNKEDIIVHLPAIKIHNQEESFNTVGYGTVSSDHSLDLACEVQGKMFKGKHEIKPGVKFRKGDLLFYVNDVEARYSLRARKSGFINLIANMLPDIKIDFNSEFDKWQDYINSIKLNESLPQLPSWKSDKEKIFLSTRNILSEYFSIKSLEEQADKYRVYAPFSGMITEVYINDFSVVNPGTRVMKIVETGNYEIPVSVSASQLSFFDIGSKASIYTTDGILKGTGTVIRISEVIDRNTQSIQVYVRPKALDGQKFIEGEYVRVEINEAGNFEGVRIPSSAIKDNQVYIYSTIDSSLTKKGISVLNENPEGIFVTGLANDDIVITQEVKNYIDTLKYGVIIE